MLAEKDENIKDASVTIAQLTQEETIRLQCEAHEDYYRRQRSVVTRMELQEMKLQEQEALIVAKEGLLEEKDAKIAALLEQLKRNGIAVEE